MLLLFSTLSLWMLQTSMPVLSQYLPTIGMASHPANSISVPVSLFLNQLVGVLHLVSAYVLLCTRAGGPGGKLSPTNNILFIAFGFMVTHGHGMHAVCVIVESQVLHSINHGQVYALVNFLHRVVSHNMFVAGHYAMILLIMKAEKANLVHKMRAMKKVDSLDQNQPTGWGIPWSLFHWTWPLVVGVYFSIFSTRTGTLLITIFFYLTIYGYTLATFLQLTATNISFGEFLEFLYQDLIVFRSIAVAAAVGMPALVVLSWRLDKFPLN